MKQVWLPLIIITSSLVLTACTQTPNQNIQLSKNIDLEAGRDQEIEPGSLTDKRKPNQQNTNQPQKGLPVKTINDFEPIETTQATLTTSKGEIIFKLYRQQAPLTTLNFLTLAKNGFYDDLVFHRVIENFMAQVGDPLTKDESQQARWGSGGPGYTISDEFHSELTHDQAGVVSMANAGPNTGGSQFFITYEPTPWLDNKHAVFGQVVSGMEVLEQIKVGDKIISVSFDEQ